MTDNSRRTDAAFEAHYQFLMWLVPTVDKFPRSHKFTTGDRILTLALARNGMPAVAISLLLTTTPNLQQFSAIIRALSQRTYAVL